MKYGLKKCLLLTLLLICKPTTYKLKHQDNEPISRDILRAIASVNCGSQDKLHRESDSKEKGGRSCIVMCKVERLPR